MGEHRRMSNRLHALLCAVLMGGLLGGLGSFGCDAPPAPDAPPKPAVAAKDGEAKDANANANAKEKDKGVPYDQCLASCNEGKLSADDRATCRLNCKADDTVDRRKVGAVDSEVTPKPVLDEFRACVGPCAKDSAADAAALASCQEGCVSKVSAAPATHQVMTGSGAKGDATALSACAKTCLSSILTCEGGCGGNTDDSATCRLNCSEQASVCLGSCGG